MRLAILRSFLSPQIGSLAEIPALQAALMSQSRLRTLISNSQDVPFVRQMQWIARLRPTQIRRIRQTPEVQKLLKDLDHRIQAFESQLIWAEEIMATQASRRDRTLRSGLLLLPYRLRILTREIEAAQQIGLNPTRSLDGFSRRIADLRP